MYHQIKQVNTGVIYKQNFKILEICIACAGTNTQTDQYICRLKAQNSLNKRNKYNKKYIYNN